MTLVTHRLDSNEGRNRIESNHHSTTASSKERAQVSVTLDIKTDALLVPEQAIWPIGKDKTVYVIEDGKAVQKTVKLGQREPGRIEIVSGIVAGDEFLTAGQMKIFDGADVNPIPATGLEN